MLLRDLGKEMKEKKINVKRGVIFGIALLLLTTSISIKNTGHTQALTQQKIIPTQLTSTEKTASYTFYIIGKNGVEKQEKILPASTALKIYEKYQELKKEMAANPQSEKTQQLTREFLMFLGENNALPAGVTTDQLTALFQPPTKLSRYLHSNILPLQSKASEWFCNFATAGQGSAFPIIILPRFIPFILTPIPRAFVWWSTPDGLTSVGGLISHTGFVAGGQQQGIALGFWGIGFSIFLPPIDAYGIFGYALYTRVNAEAIEFWPPNTPPEITQTDPADGQQMVPITTSQLRFSIEDADKDPMSYTVTTDPDIGSGSGGLKPNGMYSIPISGLESLTTYSWHIQLTDGKDSTEKTLKFTTSPTSPVVSNPLPANGEREVSIDITHLQFQLKDYQGDTLEFTVQTSPNIGSDHQIGVHNGTYSIAISGLIPGAVYRWFVNVTDGTYWTRKAYNFGTGYPSPFDPFAYGWQYRKQVTINHSKIVGNLEDFTVLLNTIDSDLMKAQATGNDILFMNNIGDAVKLHHEIEHFDTSTGTLIAWVNIPLLSSNQDTVFYLYYGNLNTIDQSYPQKTWDSQYKGVWHLNNDPTGKIVDSTINDVYGLCHGGMTQSDLVDGKIWKCLEFDGNNDFVSLQSALNGQSGTLEAWINLSGGGHEQCILTKGQSYSDSTYFMFLVSPDNRVGFYSRAVGYGGANKVYGDTDISSGWHHVVGISEGSTWSVYVDGSLESLSVEGGSNNGEWFNSFSGDTYSIGILDRPHYFGIFDGSIDEVRVSNAIDTPQWVSTLYNNQNNPSDFLNIGPEEPGP
jgi:hypothetical protein